MIELTRANFKEVVDQSGIVVIECWAPGCGACAQFDPVFASVAESNSAHTFARMNVMTEDNLGEVFEISHTPAIMLYRDGLLLLRKPGNFSEDALQDMVQQAQGLDMDAVRADIAASQTPDQRKKEEDD